LYSIDEQDTVVRLKDVPPLNVGAPLPVVIGEGGALLLAYLVNEPDPNWDGSYSRSVSARSEGMLVAVIKFRSPSAHMFGPPNDEAFQGHPLAERGLEPYAAWEVVHSSWIRTLERVNSVHPRHDPAGFMSSRRHFVWAFHDETFECIAGGYDIERHRGSIAGVTRQMLEFLHDAV
jgi:hypothetical protein